VLSVIGDVKANVEPTEIIMAISKTTTPTAFDDAVATAFLNRRRCWPAIIVIMMVVG
jgi:hypothetical protein